MNTDWSLPPSLLAKYQDSEKWFINSFYGLSMAYNRTTLNSQDRIQVPRILWQHPSLLGVVDEPNKLMVSWQDIENYDFNRIDKGVPYGLIRLEDGKILGCLSFFSRVRDTTWACLAIPEDILRLVFPIEYPVYHKTKNPWLVSIDRVFADIAMAVYRRMPFTLATLGSDVPMFFSMEDTYQELREGPDLLIPESLFQQQGVEPCGLRSPEGLWWTGGKK